MSQLGLKSRLLNIPRKQLARPWIEGLLYPRVKGREVGDGVLTRFLPNHYQYAPGSVRRVEREGFSWELDVADMMDWFLFWGLKDPALERFLSLLEPGQTVLDVGANNGRWSLHASRAVGPGGTVHAIEPFPANARRLSRNLQLNPSANVHHHAVAFGAEPGTVRMGRYDEQNLGTARVATAESDGAEDSGDVPVVRLDEWCATQGIGPVHVVKIDVEGYEESVIAGGERMLAEQHPLLFIELADDNLREQGTTAAAVVRSLEELGYRVERALDGSSVTSENPLHDCFFDVIARR